MPDPAAASPLWTPPAPGAMLRWPAPHMAPRDRLLFRSLAAFAVRQVTSVAGLENIAPANDPFILAPNHGAWREAVLVPSLLFVLRDGKLIQGCSRCILLDCDRRSQ